MKSVPFLAPAAVAIALAITGCQTAGPTDRFAAADTNHDGVLTLDEVNEYIVDQIFDARDTNHDGKISREEWGFIGKPSEDKAFRERDLNHDGFVTKQEALAYGRTHGLAKQFMKAADKNKDGKLTRAEVVAYYGSHEGSPR